MRWRTIVNGGEKMEKLIDKAVKSLNNIINQSPVNWEDFNQALDEIEDINILHETYEETILTNFIKSLACYHDGAILPKVVKCFIDHGYDVKANDGRNGGIALSELCWSSYDYHILDAAKTLLNAGAPIIYNSIDDDPNEEPAGVRGDIEWKLSGAWVVDADYDWANVLVAYDEIVNACADGDDYNGIFCHLDCIGCKLMSVEANANASFSNQGVITKFLQHFVMWFDEKPLVVCPYTEFVVNPVWVSKNRDVLERVDELFSEIIGSTLVGIRYIDATICYFDFDNGYRLFFASQDAGNRKRIGTFEIRKIQNDNKLCISNIEYMACSSGKTYAERVVDYEEKVIAFFGKDIASVLCPSPGEYGRHSICVIHCSKDLAADYTRKLMLSPPQDIEIFCVENELVEMKLHCGDKYLYLKTSDYYEIEMKLSSIDCNLAEDCSNLRQIPGNRIHFEY